MIRFKSVKDVRYNVMRFIYVKNAHTHSIVKNVAMIFTIKGNTLCIRSKRSLNRRMMANH